MDWYLPGVPADEGETLAKAMQRPEGTIVFWGVYPELLEIGTNAGLLLRVVVGELIFLLERDASMTLRFVQSSPSVGTREATIDLHPLLKPDEPCGRFFFSLSGLLLRPDCMSVGREGVTCWRDPVNLQDSHCRLPKMVKLSGSVMLAWL